MNEDLITLDSVAQLFWDYRSEDITCLRAKSRDFDHVWQTYVEGRNKKKEPTTYRLLWELWFMKFSNDTKELLITYAKERFGEQLRGRLRLSNQVKEVFNRMQQEGQ